MRLSHIFTLVFLLGGNSAWSQTNIQSVTLNEAVSLSLMNDPDLKSALATRDAGVEAKWLAISQILPNITYNFQKYPNTKTESSNVNTTGQWVTSSYDGQSKSIVFKQPIFRPREFIGVSQGNKQEDQALLTYENAFTQAVIRALGAYGSYLVDEATLKFNEATVQASKVRETAFEKMSGAGLASSIDLLRARHEKQRSLMELSNAKQQFSFSRQNFLKITGSNNIRPNTLIQTPQPDTLLIDGKFEDLIDRALNNNFEIRAGEKAVEIARLEVLKNIADHSPTVDFIAQYVQSNSASDFTIGNQYKTTQAGVVITVPLYSGGRVTAATRQADANHRKALADLQSTKNRINANFHKAYEGLNTARERWDMAVASMKANMTDLDSMKKQQNSGLKSKVDVVMAERNLAESQRDETLAKVEWILAKASLMGLMGDIEKIVGQEYTSLFSNQF